VTDSIEMLLRCAEHNILDDPGINLALTVEQTRRAQLEDIEMLEQFTGHMVMPPSDHGIDGVIPLADG